LEGRIEAGEVKGARASIATEEVTLAAAGLAEVVVGLDEGKEVDLRASSRGGRA
jgi:hypothetical protein